MIMSAAMQLLYSRCIDPQYIWILLGHPSRTRTAWSSQDHFAAKGMYVIENLIQPFEIVHTLFLALMHSKQKYRQESICMCCLHQFDVFFQNFRILQPLIWVIVSTMQRKKGSSCGFDPFLLCLLLVILSFRRSSARKQSFAAAARRRWQLEYLSRSLRQQTLYSLPPLLHLLS